MHAVDSEKGSQNLRNKMNWCKTATFVVILVMVMSLVVGININSRFSRIEVNTTTTTTTTSANNEKPQENLGVRLPADIEPLYYELKLVPFIQPGNFTFHGEV